MNRHLIKLNRTPNCEISWSSYKVGTLLFYQLFEQESSTYTYLLADEKTREAILIDGVRETLARDLQLIRELDLKLLYILDTHVHADHVTSAAALAQETGAKIGVAAVAQVDGADLQLKDGDTLQFGRHTLKVWATPGHTNTCLSFYMDDRVFTGDCLMIRGTGRTDFQQGSAPLMYQSILQKLFTLPDATLVFPAHNYKGVTHSTIGEEKKWNPRVGGGKTVEQFTQIMADLKLAPPKQIDIAVPANLKCGRV